MDEQLLESTCPHTNPLVHNIFGYLYTIDKIDCGSKSATIKSEMLNNFK